MPNYLNLLKIISLLSLLFIIGPNAKSQNNQVQPSLFLGLNPPGNSPELFAPGIVSTDRKNHSSPTFTPAYDRVYWSTYYNPETGPRTQHIFYSELIDGKLSQPQIAPFSGKYSDGNPFISKDGKRLYFASNRPIVKGDQPKDEYIYDIWYVEKTDRNNTDWSEPVRLENVNTDKHDTSPTLSDNGNLYKCSDQSGCIGTYDIFVAQLNSGSYNKPKNIGKPISTSGIEFSPFIAPDESYILFSYTGNKDKSGIHVSFKESNGSWSKPVSILKYLGLQGFSRFPSVSRDGRFLFFTKKNKRVENLYWVNAKILTEIRTSLNLK